MKKIIALFLVLTLSLLCFAACKDKNQDENDPTSTATEKTYTLSVALDSTVDDSGKITNYATALVLDESGKIVSVRLDCAELTVTATENEINDVASVVTKVEKGDGYPMTSGSFAQQTKAFEDAIVGKTADEVANLDLSLVAGCTMPYSPAGFKAVIAKAFASTNKTTFKTSESFTLGLAIDLSLLGGKATTNFGGTVVSGGKILATVLDTSERSFTAADGQIVPGEYKGTKVEQGDGYSMTSGSFAKQTEAFENHVTGKTADEVASLDLTLIAGCTMPYTPAAYQKVLAKTFANAR